MLLEIASHIVSHYRSIISYWNILVLISSFIFIIIIICCVLYYESRRPDQNNNLQSTVKERKTVRKTINILLFILFVISIFIQICLLNDVIKPDSNNSQAQNEQLVHDTANKCVLFDNASFDTVNLYLNSQQNVSYRGVCRQNQRQQ